MSGERYCKLCGGDYGFHDRTCSSLPLDVAAEERDRCVAIVADMRRRTIEYEPHNGVRRAALDDVLDALRGRR